MTTATVYGPSNSSRSQVRQADAFPSSSKADTSGPNGGPTRRRSIAVLLHKAGTANLIVVSPSGVSEAVAGQCDRRHVGVPRRTMVASTEGRRDRFSPVASWSWRTGGSPEPEQSRRHRRTRRSRCVNHGCIPGPSHEYAKRIDARSGRCFRTATWGMHRIAWSEGCQGHRQTRIER